MTARDWFEYVRSEVVELGKLDAELEARRDAAGAKAQRLDQVGHGSGNDGGSAAMDSVIEFSQSVDAKRAEVEALLEKASAILYGFDGRGGLAIARCYVDADCILGYYCYAYTWRQVADEMVRPDSVDAVQWCARRAYRALAWMDTHGWPNP